MAYPLSAYFGRKTYASLDECAYCKKPYNEAERWHTLKAVHGNIDLWCIACDECFNDPANIVEGDAE